MSINKKSALVGVSVAFVVAIFNFINILGEMVQMYNNYSKASEFSWVIFVVTVLMLAFTVALILLKITAFRRIDTAKERPWKIFLFILGIITLLSSILSIISGNILNFAFQFIQGLSFVLSFLLNKK